jgi:hypothetical protein
LIGLITLSGRRWGPAVAGWLSAFPVIGGPILFFIAYEHGSQFASAAATGTLSAVFAIIVFGIAYAWAATKFNWFGSLGIAFLFYALAVLALNAVSLSLYTTMVCDVCTIAVSPFLFPKIVASPRASTSTPFDMPLRMGIGAILVLSVTYFANTLGPRLSGIFAMFPIMSSVLAVFSHRTAGKEFAIALLKGMLLGWYSFPGFCFTLALLLEKTSIALAFSIAAAAALAIQFATRRFVRSH